MNKFYYLKKGETIRHDDECDNLDHTWNLVPLHMIGRQASDPKYTSHTNYRRLIKTSTDHDTMNE